MSDEAIEQPKSRRDVIAGLIFMGIAAGFAYEATNYDLGRAVQMGPGFIPLTIAALLGLFGVLVALAGLRQSGTSPVGPVPWRGIVLVTAALLIFGAYLTELGLVPVVFLCTVVTALASRRNGIVSALLMSVSLTLLCVLVFKVGLRLNVVEFDAATFGIPANPITDWVLSAGASLRDALGFAPPAPDA